MVIIWQQSYGLNDDKNVRIEELVLYANYTVKLSLSLK